MTASESRSTRTSTGRRSGFATTAPVEWRWNGACTRWLLTGGPQPPESYEVFPATALALATGGTPPAPLDELWDGLEAFAAYGDEVEPGPLAAAAARALDIGPDAFGLVDHESIADEWERASGGISIVSGLLRQLEVGA